LSNVDLPHSSPGVCRYLHTLDNIPTICGYYDKTVLGHLKSWKLFCNHTHTKNISIYNYSWNHHSPLLAFMFNSLRKLPLISILRKKNVMIKFINKYYNIYLQLVAFFLQKILAYNMKKSPPKRIWGTAKQISFGRQSKQYTNCIISSTLMLRSSIEIVWR
jgi:hypothetical protein